MGLAVDAVGCCLTVGSVLCPGLPCAQAHWVVEGAQSRCIVVTEGDPLPSATVGRMSFRGFNPATERLAPEALKGTAAGAAEAEAGDGGGVSVSDADMAAHVAPRNQQQQEQQINSGGKRKGQHGEPEANGAGREEQQQQQQQQQRGGRPGHSGGRGGGGGHKRQRYF